MTNASDITVTVHHQIPGQELLGIQKLRYKVYAEELKLPLACMNHSRRLLSDPMDEPAIHILAKTNDALSGAIRLNLDNVPQGLELSLGIASLPRPFMYCARLFVLPEWRGTAVMNCLTRAGFDQVAKCGAAVAICHCYPHLQKLYRRMGFRPYGTPFAIPGLEYLGEQIPMCYAATERQLSQAA